MASLGSSDVQAKTGQRSMRGILKVISIEITKTNDRSH